jgi:hypothetical protein
MAVQQGLAQGGVCAQQSAGKPFADSRPCAVVGGDQVRGFAQGVKLLDGPGAPSE